MLAVASTVSQFAEGSGLIAAAIAVGGFLAHAPRALAGAKDEALVLVFVLLLGGGGFAVSEVVGHYEERETRKRRQSHSAPPNG